MLTCPYCAIKAISLWRKCVLGSDAAVPCASCGKLLGIPWLASLAALPLALGIFGVVTLPLPWFILSVVGARRAYLAIQRFLVPLIPRDT